MLPQTINIKYLKPENGDGISYVIADKDVIINCDTTSGPIRLYLPNIQGSNLIGNPRIICINDLGGQCALYPITIYTSGTDTIMNENSVVLNVNYIQVQCFIADINKWNVNDLGMKLPLYPQFVSSGALQFQIDTIYGTPSAPITGNLTLSAEALARGKQGVTNLIIHNDGAEPSYPAAFKLLNGTYTINVNNYIYATFLNSGNILYTISQVQ